VTKAKEQKRKKQEEYNQVCKEFADVYGIALSPGERYRAVALDGTHFQVCAYFTLVSLGFGKSDSGISGINAHKSNVNKHQKKF
jgi:hypothetical protein